MTPKPPKNMTASFLTRELARGREGGIRIGPDTYAPVVALRNEGPGRRAESIRWSVTLAMPDGTEKTVRVTTVN